MTTVPLNYSEVTHAIQLALAPVFLLTGIAGVLNVMTGRLARIIDRGRALTESAALRETIGIEALVAELRNLERRRRIASAAINASTLSALLVCIVVATLFVEELTNFPLKSIVGVLFTSSTLALVVGLAFFLIEVHLATQTVRIRPWVQSDATRSNAKP